ncbi:MAG: DNA repair protein RecN [Flammeovirgaceae bacterium]
MLKQLLIKNYALIQHLEIYPSPSLNIITGETGAGKSIMLGALGLLMGGRADTKVLFNEQDKCVIEATFEVDVPHLEEKFVALELEFDNTCILRREISANGKSRAFINDTPVNLDALKQIGTSLMDIHSQHDTLMLGADVYQLSILDSFGQLDAELARYQASYKAFLKAEKAYQQLLRENEAMQKEFDFNSFQLKELLEANLENIDQDFLEKELELLENTESIKSGLNAALALLSQSEYCAETSIKSAIQQLAPLAGFSNDLEDIKTRAESCLIELRDIIREIERQENNLEFDQEREQSIREQLDTLYALQKKHRVESVDELIALRNSLQEKVDKVVNFDEELRTALNNKEEAERQMLTMANQLSDKRKQQISLISTAINQLLAGLGMPNAVLKVEINKTNPTDTGIDAVQFLFSGNKGISPQPLKNVASGGEFSRLMLAVKYVLATKTHLPTIIFDEIDTGISGEIAMRVGSMMQEMAQKMQVLVISHLPQMAAMGNQHYFVYKDNSSERAISKIKLLTVEERIAEIAQMIGGSSPSESAYRSARELMGLEKQERLLK